MLSYFLGTVVKSRGGSRRGGMGAVAPPPPPNDFLFTNMSDLVTQSNKNPSFIHNWQHYDNLIQFS